MSAKTITSSEYPAVHDRPSDAESALSFSVLDRRPPRAGRRLAALVGPHPVWTYAFGVLVSFLSIATLSVLAGLLVTHVLIRSHGVAADDESVVRFLVRHRSRDLTDASLVGSIMAGGVVLPIVAGVAALAAAIVKHWRLGGFLLFALAVESGSYRATTLLVHRHRPEVPRLEKLPVNASYPSGHTAASIAVYCGIALLLSSKVSSLGARIAIWSLAVLIPVFVALSRMYRGMHHPLDLAGGAVVGIAALLAMVTVSRAAHLADSARGRTQ